jgi:hypothetical protein
LPEQPAEIGEDSQQGGKIAERQEEQKDENGADQIKVKWRPLTGWLAAGRTVIVEAADRGMTMRAGPQRRCAPQLHFE